MDSSPQVGDPVCILLTMAATVFWLIIGAQYLLEKEVEHVNPRRILALASRTRLSVLTAPVSVLADALSYHWSYSWVTLVP